MTRIVLVVLLCAVSAAAQGAAGLPRDSRVPGGVAVIDLAPVETTEAPRARFNDTPVAVVAHNNRWKAIVGLPLSLAPGRQALLAEFGGAARTFEFVVTDKQYPTQHLAIKEKRHVEPLPEDLARIEKESAEIDRTFRHWNGEQPSGFQLALPSQGRLSSGFGLKRVLNGKPRAPHTGLDIAAPVGTPVVAPAPGRVLATGDYFFTGNTVFVDHGQGFITLYIHLNAISVTPGTVVNTGDPLGEIGLTGRTTGAHLHWAVSLNNVRVDPVLFLPATGAGNNAKPATGVQREKRTPPVKVSDPTPAAADRARQ